MICAMRWKHRREVDLIEHFAAAIPVEVIGNLLGVPRDERGAFATGRWPSSARSTPRCLPRRWHSGQRSVSEFLEFSRVLVADRRKHLRGEDDLLSRLILDATGGEPLGERELLHNCIFLLNAGHETTTNLIGNALALLLASPCSDSVCKRPRPC